MPSRRWQRPAGCGVRYERAKHPDYRRCGCHANPLGRRCGGRRCGAVVQPCEQARMGPITAPGTRDGNRFPPRDARNTGRKKPHHEECGGSYEL